MAEGLGAAPVPPMGLDNHSVQRDATGGSDDGSLILLVLLLLLTVPAAHYVNKVVPNGYMDEEFHFNQVEHYCRGDFAYWDPKITTLPGLYLASLVYIEILLPGADYFGYGSTLSDLCSNSSVLRSVNLVLFGVCALLFREIALHLDPAKHPIRASLKALVLSLYPLHWFFSLLYYTEMGSAAAVMAMYLASLKRSYWISAFIGVLAIMFRQTNVVWVCFVLCVGVLDFLEPSPLPRRHDPSDGSRREAKDDEVENDEQGSTSNQALRDGLRQRRSSSDPNAQQPIVTSVSSNTVSGGVFLELKYLFESAWIHRTAVVWNFSPFILVLLVFIGFVIKNGSVALGDKDAHKMSPHLAQILYCGLVCAAFQPTVHFSPQRISELLGVVKRKTVFSTLGLGIVLATTFAGIAVHFYGDPHPYLLADNRHYTFYIWKDLVQAHWSLKYLAIPLYIYSWASILSYLTEWQKPLWIAAFSLAVTSVLVPTSLLEFRYYNVPFYFTFLHISTSASTRKRTTRLFFTPFQFMFVNYLTLYVFLNWTFHWSWSDQPGAVQRFMW